MNNKSPSMKAFFVLSKMFNKEINFSIFLHIFLMSHIYNSHPRIHGDLLDRYLAVGWYRMGNLVFTTEEIDVDGHQCEVHWLRYPLKDFKHSKKNLALLKTSEKFVISMKRLKITKEMDALYDKYYKSVSFSTSAKLRDNLCIAPNDKQTDHQIFDTYCIKIYDNEKLIAFGIFDNGYETIAGILNCIDPEYKKYSLGKLLILLKINIARNNDKKYYYPGYVAKGWDKFDYKLFLGKDDAEIWDVASKTWVNYWKSKLIIPTK
jgi:leucyl-tRNA---protein transferase